MRDCIFCKIVKGEIPASKLLENNEVLSFLDINPVNPGHILVMPKKHYQTVMEIPGKELGRVMEMVPDLSRAVVKVTGAEGLNLFQTNKACAGQTIPHVHFHIIPRHSNDGFSFGWRQGKYPQGEMERLQKDILKTLGDYKQR